MAEDKSVRSGGDLRMRLGEKEEERTMARWAGDLARGRA